ncbi:Histone-Lysine N-Methyltransferase ash1l [Linnemannia zychae]|nr:Histone-Lysine N-Methyltransferase ash1l [Linnemannia zychae]
MPLSPALTSRRTNTPSKALRNIIGNVHNTTAPNSTESQNEAGDTKDSNNIDTPGHGHHHLLLHMDPERRHHDQEQGHPGRSSVATALPSGPYYSSALAETDQPTDRWAHRRSPQQASLFADGNPDVDTLSGSLEHTLSTSFPNLAKPVTQQHPQDSENTDRLHPISITTPTTTHATRPHISIDTSPIALQRRRSPASFDLSLPFATANTAHHNQQAPSKSSSANSTTTISRQNNSSNSSSPSQLSLGLGTSKKTSSYPPTSILSSSLSKLPTPSSTPSTPPKRHVSLSWNLPVTNPKQISPSSQGSSSSHNLSPAVPVISPPSADDSHGSTANNNHLTPSIPINRYRSKSFSSVSSEDSPHSSTLSSHRSNSLSAAMVTSSSYSSLPYSPAVAFLSNFVDATAPKAAVDEEGAQVGDYVLGRVIGHGGFSIVREAMSLQMDETGQVERVAVKIVKTQTGATDNDRVQKMLRKEIAIWSQVSHPHVLPFLGVEKLPTDTFIFCELCTGGHLLNYLSLRSDALPQSTTPTTPGSAKPLEEDEARAIFNQVAEAVRYLHEERRIVHRDIKLENILRHEDGTWKICDFGLAEYQDEEAALCFGESLMSPCAKSPSTLLTSPEHDGQGKGVGEREEEKGEEEEEMCGGSLAYSSPEQLRSCKPLRCPSSDVWSLGVVLYALLTGRLPFQDEYEPRLQYQILNGRYEEPEECSVEARDLLKNMFRSKPEDRWRIGQRHHIRQTVIVSTTTATSRQQASSKQQQQQAAKQLQQQVQAREGQIHPHKATQLIAMAIKSKKRKLTTSGRSAAEASSATSQAEAELEREEEEMLAMTRLLKQVNETEAVLVTKKLILEASASSGTPNGTGTGSDGVNGHSGDTVTVQQHVTVVQSIHVNGSTSTRDGSTGLEVQDGAHWVGNLTVENVERQNDTHERERLEQSQDQDRDAASVQQEPTTTSTAGGSNIAANESRDPVATRSSLRASLRKPPQSLDGLNGTSTDGGSSRPVRAISARSEVSDTYSSTGSSNSLAASLPIIFKPDEAEGSTSAIISGFEMPIKDLTQPRLSQALISRKARTIYAPETAKTQPVVVTPEIAKRRPGRPPGYFLGPTSCAFCRQQHRRCDYNTVCHRCIKAKIPCDRSGTVERPSIIVREARIQAKAEAAAVLELAVAAGYAEQPDPKTAQKPRSKPTTVPSRSSARVQSLEQNSQQSSSPSPGSSSATREGVKRRRSPSPGSVSRDNILQQRVKRVATPKGSKAQEAIPSSKSRGTAAGKSRAESSSSRNGPSSISASEDGQLEVIESNHADYNDGHQDETNSPAPNPTASSSTPSSSQSKAKTPVGTPSTAKSSKTIITATPTVAVQRAYKSAAELARIAPPNVLPKVSRVRVRVAKTADTTGKRKAGRPPGGKFVPTPAHLTPANQAVLIRAQSVSNPQAVEPETMRMMMMLKRRPGRPPWKHTLPQPDPVVKRPVGRPTNAERFAMNPGLLPSLNGVDARYGPGRPLGSPNASVTPTSSSTQAKHLIHAKPSKSSSSKAVSAPSKSVVPAKRTHATASGSQTQISTSKSASSKGKSVTSRTEDTTDESTGSSKSQTIKTDQRLVKKVYLKSGLYSSDLKVNATDNGKNGTKSLGVSRAIVSSRQRAKAESAAAATNSFFELPINYGAVLMSRQKDFSLPFDIIQASQLGLLRKTVQPEPFIKIRSNIFVERKRRTESSPMVCHCKPPRPDQGRIGCGDDCYNRVMFYECISAHCPCGDLCSNQRFQKRHNEDHLRVIWTQERGFGIQTTAPIKKGNLVIEYRGEVISQAECHKRMEGIYKNNKNFYFLEYEKGEVVDACQKGTNARFVNHSCSPNSQIEKWFLNGEMSIGIFAAQDIPAGAEISYDYNFSSFSGAQKQKCRCGAANCRGYIGERLSKNKEAAMALTTKVVSGRSGSKASAKKRKTGRRGGVNEQESSSMRLGQMPSLGSIRQRQSDKYKEGKMAAIRYTGLFLFRNIRLVESKYVKYAQTKSRSFHERVSPTWLAQARQCRKRSLEGVIEELRENAMEQAAVHNQEVFTDDLDHAESSIEGDDSSEFQSTSIMEIQDTDQEDDGEHDDSADGMSHYGLSEGSPSHGSHQPYEEGIEYEEYEENGHEADHEYVDEEVEGSAAEYVEDIEEREDREEYGDVNGIEVKVKVASSALVVSELKAKGTGTKNRSVSAESLNSTVAAEYSPVSVQGSVDTLVEDARMVGPKDPEVGTDGLDESKNEFGSRRLRTRNS